MNTQETITKIIEQLKGTDGVQALALGGSRARGTGHEHSDIGLAILHGLIEETDRLINPSGGAL